MKVSELIARLSKLPPDEETIVLTSGDNPVLGDGYIIGNVYEIQGHDSASGAYIEVFN